VQTIAVLIARVHADAKRVAQPIDRQSLRSRELCEGEWRTFFLYYFCVSCRINLG
jgi:hypothetical protein